MTTIMLADGCLSLIGFNIPDRLLSVYGEKTCDRIFMLIFHFRKSIPVFDFPRFVLCYLVTCVENDCSMQVVEWLAPKTCAAISF